MATYSDGSLEKAMERYRQHFGIDFFIQWPPCSTSTELVQQIDICISTGIPQPEPEYTEGVDY